MPLNSLEHTPLPPTTSCGGEAPGAGREEGWPAEGPGSRPGSERPGFGRACRKTLPPGGPRRQLRRRRRGGSRGRCDTAPGAGPVRGSRTAGPVAKFPACERRRAGRTSPQTPAMRQLLLLAPLGWLLLAEAKGDAKPEGEGVGRAGRAGLGAAGLRGRPGLPRGSGFRPLGH